MKEVNWERIKKGDLVQVPRTEFAPRHGWNGWLFSDAVVIGKRISRKTGKKIIDVEMYTPGPHKHEYNTLRKSFYSYNVFETNDKERTEGLLESWGIKSRDDFEAALEDDDFSDMGEVKFLIDKNIIFAE